MEDNSFRSIKKYWISQNQQHQGFGNGLKLIWKDRRVN